MRYRKLLFLIFLIGGLLLSVPAWGRPETIIPGVSINGASLGGLDEAQVTRFLEFKEKEISSQKIFFKVPGEGDMISLAYHELGVALNKEKIWEEGYSLGRKGKWWQRWLTRWEVKRKGYAIPLYLKIDGPAAIRSLQSRVQTWEKEAQDARFMISAADKVHILPEVYGQAVDLEQVKGELEKKLTAYQEQDLTLELTLKNIRPKKLKTDLEAYSVKGLVTAFSTKFNPAQKNRTKNIRLAVSALDGYLLEPGGIFSFNQVVGPRTKEKGYDEADTFLNYEVVPGIGGGVCQVSTTLYNAVLRSSLEVVERYPHSLMIRYVEPGRDAAVAYESKDFRFRNTMDCCLLFKAGVSGETLTFKIYGLPDSKTRFVIKSIQEQELTPPTIFKEAPEVPKGQYLLGREGSPGYIIRVERHIYTPEGKLHSRETISRDIYSPVPRVIMTSSSLLSN